MNLPARSTSAASPPATGQHRSEQRPPHVVIRASAGTGKTFQLSNRYLKLILLGHSAERILATTFTRKAAREMQTRIRKAIENKLKDHPDNPVWQSRALTMDELQISTIHGLCSRLLRENSIDIGLDPQFNVLNEQETELIKDEAIQKTLANLVENDDPSLSLLDSLQVRDLQNGMIDLQAKRGTVQQVFDSLPDTDELLDRWSSKLKEMQGDLWEEYQERFPDLEQVMDDILLVDIKDESDKLTPSVLAAKSGSRSVLSGNRVEGVQDWCTIRLVGGKKDNWGGEDFLRELKDSLRILQSVGRGLEKYGFCVSIVEADRRACDDLQKWKQIWIKLNQIYRDMKNTRGVLDFDDLEFLTRDLLEKSPRYQRIKKYISSINHVLVDEFQDTNLRQQEIIYALAPPADPGKLFVVGDAKQSIYRFRQAQVSIFQQTIKDVQRITGFKPEKLRISFRSHGSLVTALNELFDEVFQPLAAEYKAYEALPGPLSANRKSPLDSNSISSPVEILVLPNKLPDGTKINAEEGRIWEARWIAERLHNLHENGVQVFDHAIGAYIPFEYRHAAILFRATTQFPLYEEEFKSFGLPYLTISGRGYFNRPEINDILALLACIDNPMDDLNLATALRSPLFCLSDDTLFKLRWLSTNNTLSKTPIKYAHSLANPPGTSQNKQVKDSYEILSHLWNNKGRQEISIILQDILDLTAYEATLAFSDGENDRQLSNVKKFMQFVLQHQGVSLSKFIRLVQDLRARETREGEAVGRTPEGGGVQLMSIHAAKGLEFPVVCVADLGRSRSGARSSSIIKQDPSFGIAIKIRDQDGSWIEPGSYFLASRLDYRMDEAEEKRLLYVAATRASEMLILSGRVGNKSSWIQKILDYWQINTQNSEEGIISREGYSIHVYSPENMLKSHRIPVQEGSIQTSLDTLPALSCELPTTNRRYPVSASELLQIINHPIEPRFSPPFAHPPDDTSDTRTPQYVLGKIIHHTLADWDCLNLDTPELKQRLGRWVRQEGVFQNEERTNIIKRVIYVLRELRRHQIYPDINQSVFKEHEFNFNFSSQIGTIHGIIDILYQDSDHHWYILDWKTEWLDKDAASQYTLKYKTQLAIYYKAVQETLGIKPFAKICSLRPHIAIFPYTPDELEKSWDSIVKKSMTAHVSVN